MTWNELVERLRAAGRDGVVRVDEEYDFPILLDPILDEDGRVLAYEVLAPTPYGGWDTIYNLPVRVRGRVEWRSSGGIADWVPSLRGRVRNREGVALTVEEAMAVTEGEDA